MGKVVLPVVCTAISGRRCFVVHARTPSMQSVEFQTLHEARKIHQ